MRISFNLTLILLLSLSACGKGSSGHNQGLEKRQFHGTFSQNIEEIHQGKYRDDCEAKYEILQTEIAGALDARESEIAAVVDRVRFLIRTVRLTPLPILLKGAR